MAHSAHNIPSSSAEKIIRSSRSPSMLLGQVDILITVSGFAPTPSLSSAVACRFAMRSDVRAFSLSGHGCAGGLVGIDLAQALLLVQDPWPVPRLLCRAWKLRMSRADSSGPMVISVLRARPCCCSAADEPARGHAPPVAGHPPSSASAA